MPPPSDGTQVLRGVATDGHRLARVEVPLPKGAAEIPGVIVPRKTVGEVRKLLDESDGSVEIELSDTRIRFASGGVTLVSKLIDGTFPDYERVIPTGNDKVLNVPCKEFAHAVDRVSTISTEKSRAVKLAVAKGVVTLSATSPDAGSATEEIEVEYKAAALEIGFNSRYLLDITEQIAGSEARFLMADAGSPTAGARRRRRERALRADADAGMTAPPISALAYSPDAATGAAPAVLAVRQLRLTDFRNYRQLRLDCGPEPVVLVGANGAGKTNLLEALSFLAPGRGLRRARLDEVGRRSRAGEPDAAAWAVAATLDTPEGRLAIGTGLEPAKSEGSLPRRAVRIDGRPARARPRLACMSRPSG